jgi:hypothetical protein
MSAMAEQMAATLAVMGQQIDETVASCSYAYKDDLGAAQTWAGTGMLTELQGQAAYLPDGQWFQEGWSALFTIADFPAARWPREGDIMSVRFGDDAARDYVVRNPQPSARTIMRLTLERRFST